MTEHYHQTHSVKSLVKANFFYLGLTFINRAMGFILIPLYLSFLTIEQYGILALMVASQDLLTIFCTLNLGSALQTFYFNYHQDQELLRAYVSKIFRLAIRSGIIFAVVGTAIGPWLFPLFLKEDGIQFFPLGIVTLLFSILAAINYTFFNYLRNGSRLREYAHYVLFQMTIIIVSQVILLVILDLGVFGALLGILVSQACTFLLIVFRNPWILTGPDSSARWSLSDSVRYGVNLMPFMAIQWILTRGDRFIVERVLDLEAVGEYAVIANVSMLIAVVATSFLTAIRPFFFDELVQSAGKITKRLVRVLIFFLMLLLGVAITIYLAFPLLHFIIDSTVIERTGKLLHLGLALFLVRNGVRYFEEYMTFHKKSRDMSIISVFHLIFFLAVILLVYDNLTLEGLLTILIWTNSALFGTMVVRTLIINASLNGTVENS